MRPTSSAERKTKPSAEDTKPTGWLTKSLNRVGRCVSVIQTRKRPRRASSSGRRSSLGRCIGGNEPASGNASTHYRGGCYLLDAPLDFGLRRTENGGWERMCC